MLNFDIKRKINTLRDILVGKVPDPKAQVEQITIALIYKFMDDMDIEGMEFGGSREFFKDDYEKYAWSNIMQPENSGQQRANLYAEGIDKMSMNPHLPQLFRDIFRGAYVPYRDAETLNMFLKEINDFTYDHSEELGNAFEYLLSIMGSQGDAGQFRTPRHIIDMMVEIVDPQKTDSILDPACGTAGFLISSYKHILEKNKDSDGNSTLSADDRKRMTENFAGYDISPDMVRLSRVNMYLHKFAKPQISEYDTLSSLDKWDETYDVILANPPFMTPKGGIIPHNRYRIPAKRAEVLFVDYIAEHLNPTGKAGIIVPEGIVFQSANAYKSLRKYLVEDGLLYAVISLPAGVFNPYSGVKTSILLMDKTLAKQKDEILFVKINNDGYDLGAQRREVNGSDIPEVKRIIKDYQNGKDVSDNALVTIASKRDIAEQDYILVGERYKEATDISTNFPMVELGDILDYEQPTNYIVESVDYNESYEIPVLTAGQSFILGYTNETTGIFKDNLPVIIFDDFTTASKFVDFPFKVKSSAMKILKPRDGVNLKYVYYTMKNIQFNSEIHKRYWISEYSKVRIPLPPLHIQEEIVKEIDGYQKIIDGAKQVVENYKPTIKIDPSWEMVRVGDVCDLLIGSTPSKQNADYWTDGTIKWISSKHIDNGRVIGYELITEEALNNSSTKIAPKDSTILITRVSVGKVAFADDNYAINQDMTALIPSDRLCPRFLFYYSSLLAKSVEKDAQGIGVRGVTQKYVADLTMPLPTIEVQQTIVDSLNEEMTIVEQNKRLIELFEQKIRDKISEVWGE